LSYGSKKMAISSVNGARGGTWFTDDCENSLFEAELKFCVFTPKKNSVDLTIPVICFKVLIK
jgi:hypothetical protein